MCWSFFLMKFQAFRPVTLLKSDSGKGVSLWILRSFKKQLFLEYLRTAASESVWYLVYTLLSDVHLEEKEEYKNYLRITPECFNKLFVLVKDITKKSTNIKDTSTLKVKLAGWKNISCSFICSLIFLIFSSYVMI